MSHGRNETLVLTLSPVALGPTGPGPSALFHQLHSASKTPSTVLFTPYLVLPVMLLWLMWISRPVTSQPSPILVFTPSKELEIVLSVIVM